MRREETPMSEGSRWDRNHLVENFGNLIVLARHY